MLFSRCALLTSAALALPFVMVASSKVQPDYGKLPLTFEVNQGQTDPRVKFLAHGDGCGLFLTPDEAVLTFAAKDDVLRMRFAGAKREPRMEGIAPTPGK